MCWGLHIMDGDKVTTMIDTAAAAVSFFGIQHVHYYDRPYDPAKDGDHCLCPIDTPRLVKECGYKFIPSDDPRWDCMDHRIEK